MSKREEFIQKTCASCSKYSGGITRQICPISVHFAIGQHGEEITGDEEKGFSCVSYEKKPPRGISFRHGEST